MSRKANRFKVIGGLLVVAMAMFAVFAGQASAFTWTTTATVAPESSMEIGVEASGSSVLTGIVSGLAIELTAKKVVAVKPTVIHQGAKEGAATATGALTYSELSLQKPVGCGAPASITTKGLKAELATSAGLTSGAAMKFRPSSTTEPLLFATVTLTGECALAGTPFKVTIPSGSFFCAEVEPFGTMAKKQPIRTSATINSNCGGKLEAGGNPAALTGTAKGFSLESGEPEWGASNTVGGI